ncbi:YkgJ family cysteine cluster protein [candidate division KSB1 bacterium]|nr:YkgJ family cysteine cluster protein [candidate division KSB1 bacterium]
MQLITDLTKIKELARVKENANWKFRSFLKMIDLSEEELDAIVHRIYKKVASEIDCTQCANCCKKTEPLLSEHDIEKFAEGLKMSVNEFKSNSLKVVEDEFGKKKMIFNKLPCPFLKNNLCTNYEYRPNDCQSFPHLHKKGFNSRTMSVIDNYEICPIVFNVYELLKKELWHRDLNFDGENFW